MSEEILLNVTPFEIRAAYLEKTILQEIHIERVEQQGLVGNIYRGRVNRLMPGIQAAFIDLGLERAAFLHVSDILGATESSNIADFLKPAQELLVQVYKDSIGGKGARLTTQVTIPSRYLVLTPNVKEIAFSQKITDEKERARLRSFISVTEENGYIFRTSAIGATQKDIEEDKKNLDAIWEAALSRSRSATHGDVIYAEMPMVFRLMRDFASRDIDRIRVDCEKTANEMKTYAKQFIPALFDRITCYAEKFPIFDLYQVEEELQKALHRKVYLKSGGHLIIDQTEAMTTIDVNTGSYLGKNNLEETIFKTNVEAVEVIARQIRLRNLGGIIIVDFIDMNEAVHKDTLLQLLKVAVEKDPVKTQVSELSSLGLVQMTRKRVRESLERVLCEPCHVCHRRGSLKSISTMCYEIIRDLKRSAEFYPWRGFLVLANAEVVAAFHEHYQLFLKELEATLVKPIQLKVEISFTQEHYNILPLDLSSGGNSVALTLDV